MENKDSEGKVSPEDLIHYAEESIGPDDPEDCRIQPTIFSTELKNKAREFSAVLEHSSLTETAKPYEEQDGIALTPQSSFRRLSERSTWAIFIATTAAAFLASLTAILPENPGFLSTSVAVLLGLCSLGGGSVAAFTLYRVNNEHLLQRWMSARAAAESERLG